MSLVKNEPIGGEEPKNLNLEIDQENELRGLMPDFEPKGKEAGGKTEKEPPKEQVMIVSMLYAGLFGILASRLGDHWALNEQEVAALALPTVAVVDKYFPNAKVGVEVALMSAVAMVMVPRVMLTMQQKPIEGEVSTDGDKSEHNAKE